MSAAEEEIRAFFSRLLVNDGDILTEEDALGASLYGERVITIGNENQRRNLALDIAFRVKDELMKCQLKGAA